MVSHFATWSHDVDPPLANEDAQIDDIVASGTVIQQQSFDTHRHSGRLTHQKTQAVLKGTLEIFGDLAPELAQGVFERPGTYEAACRFANEPSALLDDRSGQPRGLGLRVFGVRGVPIDGTADVSLACDFLFNNAPMIELRDVPTYRKIEALRAKHGVGTLALDAALATSGDAMVQLAPKTLPATHLVAQKYYSQSAFRWGDYIGKYALFPSTETQAAIEKEGKTPDHAHHMSEFLRDYFADHDAEFDFRVQLKPEGVDGFSIEDLATPWDEGKSPYQTVGKLTLPKQQSFTPARRTFWEDKMSLDPWKNNLEAHRPLGSLNRSRRKAYSASAKFRSEKNACPVLHVTEIKDIPD